MLSTLDAAGLIAFRELESSAVAAVTKRLSEAFSAEEAGMSGTARLSCEEDVCLCLEFLRAALEFGTRQPMVNYLHWQGSTVPKHSLAAAHIAPTLGFLAGYFAAYLRLPD
jgi:hypothetical protein